VRMRMLALLIFFFSNPSKDFNVCTPVEPLHTQRTISSELSQTLRPLRDFFVFLLLGWRIKWTLPGSIYSTDSCSQPLVSLNVTKFSSMPSWPSRVSSFHRNVQQLCSPVHLCTHSMPTWKSSRRILNDYGPPSTSQQSSSLCALPYTRSMPTR
jgi:hypothetical protein